MNTALFRRDGRYWGFLENGEIYDRHGRHAGWLMPGPEQDVYDLTGRFLGQLVEGHHVLRSVFRPEPVHRAPRPPTHHATPPDPWPDREPALAIDGWAEALPWPLRPPDPPQM